MDLDYAIDCYQAYLLEARLHLSFEYGHQRFSQVSKFGLYLEIVLEDEPQVEDFTQANLDKFLKASKDVMDSEEYALLPYSIRDFYEFLTSCISGELIQKYDMFEDEGFDELDDLKPIKFPIDEELYETKYRLVESGPFDGDDDDDYDDDDEDYD